jgi:hypothetical protein
MVVVVLPTLGGGRFIHVGSGRFIQCGRFIHLATIGAELSTPPPPLFSSNVVDLSTLVDLSNLVKSASFISSDFSSNRAGIVRRYFLGPWNPIFWFLVSHPLPSSLVVIFDTCVVSLKPARAASLDRLGKQVSLFLSRKE